MAAGTGSMGLICVPCIEAGWGLETRLQQGWVAHSQGLAFPVGEKLDSLVDGIFPKISPDLNVCRWVWQKNSGICFLDILLINKADKSLCTSHQGRKIQPLKVYFP